MWANALKCIEQLAKPQYASFVLRITAAMTLPALFYCITKIVKIVNQAEIYIAYIAHAGISLPPPLFVSLSTPLTAFDIIAKFHFRSGLTGNVHVPPSNSLSLSLYLSLFLSFYACLPLTLFPSLFLTIFMFQYFIICSKRILCCCSLVLLQNYLCIMLAKWAWH